MPHKARCSYDEDYADDYGDDDYDYENYDDDDVEPGYERREAAVAQGSTTWRCSVCTFDNSEEARVCDICGVIRKGLPTDDHSASSSSSFKPSANVSSSATVSTSTSESSQTSNAVPSEIHEAVGTAPKLNTIPANRSFTGGRQKIEKISSSISSINLNEKPLSDGVGFGKVSFKETGNDKLQKGKQFPLELYKPEPWMVNDLRKENKQALNLSIVGHVDAGKSTLLGKLLYLFGQISQKDMRKYEREAKEKGKGSFAYAWVLDESSEERARGVTMTVAVAHFETTNFHVVVLDSPGHKDFVPNMISGASQADAVLLVVDASFGAFEAGMKGEGKGGGQTKEHTQLARSFGIEQIIVAVNKMDIVNYSQERFNEIKESLRSFLRQCGFKDSGIKWVPISAIENQNLMRSPSEDLFKSWYSGASLVDVIDELEPPPRAISKPLRIPIAEVIKTRSLGQATISGKLESGAIKVGSKVLVMPLRDVATVRGIEQAGHSRPSAWAGESTDIGLQGVEPSTLVPGGVLCHPDYPVSVVSCLEAKILVLEVVIPVLCGSQVILHCHQAKEPARITKLISVLDPKTGAVTRRKPRCLVAHQSALIELIPERPICAEEYSNYRALGRISLRDAGKTLAVGIIVHITKHE